MFNSHNTFCIWLYIVNVQQVCSHAHMTLYPDQGFLYSGVFLTNVTTKQNVITKKMGLLVGPVEICKSPSADFR